MGGYTPGPWFIPTTPGSSGGIAHEGGYIAFVAMPRKVSEQQLDGESWLEMRRRTDPEREANKREELANQRLITAAPELLEALQRIEAHLSAIGTPRDSRGRYHKDGEWTFDNALPRDVDAREVKSAFEVVRAAISRATGEGE